MLRAKKESWFVEWPWRPAGVAFRRAAAGGVYKLLLLLQT
jgi:hypothetical protein